MERKRQRSVYATAKQKKKLFQLIAKNPELISGRVTQDFNHKDSQQLWNNIANECNLIPGARKTWRQWRKTWQDIRCKAKKKHERSGEIPSSALVLTPAEQEALGLKNVSSTTYYQESTEFVCPLEIDNVEDNFVDDIASTASLSEPESPLEEKVFTETQSKVKKNTRSKTNNSNHSDNCLYNCDMLAIQEQKKVQMKEDYYNFKKDYLRQKLLVLKEQTEALKSIAKELGK